MSYFTSIFFLFFFSQPPEQDTLSPPRILVGRYANLNRSVIKRVEPVYPNEAAQQGIVGSIVVEVNLDEKGKVIAAKALTGHSMKGKVNDGDLVTVEPCKPDDLAVGDIVLVRVKGHDYLHLIKALGNGRFLIGNNRGGINGWVGHHSVYGKATKIQPH